MAAIRSTWLRRAATIGGGGGVVLAAAVGAAAVYADDQSLRALHFLSTAAPIVAHYRLTQQYCRLRGLPEEERKDVYGKLHDRYSPVVDSLARSLRGFYIKLGQFLGTRSDIFPPQFVAVGRGLEDNCPAMGLDEVRAIVEEETGKVWSEIFEAIDEKPLGSASIGQVHRARLASSGAVVAVKVQHPRVEYFFRGDVATIKGFLTLFLPEYEPFIDELERSFKVEFEYTREAEALKRVHDNMRVFRDRVAVPRPITELCSKRMLVMEYLPGKKLVTVLKRQWEAFARAHNLSFEELRDSIAHDNHASSSSSSTADSFSKKKRKKSMGGAIAGMYVWSIGVRAWEATRNAAIRVKTVLGNGGVFIVNNSVGLFSPRLRLPYQSLSLPPSTRRLLNETILLNPGRILDTLLHVHGHQIFVNGFFNGDCHPGNILLLDDGRLGLIDYGQARDLSRENRVKFAELVMALIQGSDSEIASKHAAIGFRTQHMTEYALVKSAVVVYDRDTIDVTEGKSVQQFFEHLGRVDPTVSVPGDFVMVGRCVILLRGLCHILNRPGVSIAKEWEMFARKTINEEKKRKKKIPKSDFE